MCNLNLFSYTNKNNRRLNIMISVPSDAEYYKFRGVILTNNNRQTKRRLKGRFMYSGMIGHFYPFTDDKFRGVFVQNLFGTDMHMIHVNKSSLLEIPDEIIESLMQYEYADFSTFAVPLKKFGYKSDSDFYHTCFAHGIRCNYLAHSHSDACISIKASKHIRRGSATIKTIGYWIAITGPNVPKSLGYKSAEKMLASWEAVTGKPCYANGDHFFLQV